MKITYNDWIFECDVEATRRIYSEITQSGADKCGCNYCENYSLNRDSVFPEEAQQFLAHMGVDWRREAEAVEYGEESGLHIYGGWLHFVGNIEQVGKEVQVTDNFSLNFSQDYAPMLPQFKDEIVSRIDFFTRLPWIFKK